MNASTIEAKTDGEGARARRAPSRDEAPRGAETILLVHAEALGSGRAFIQEPFTPGTLARTVRDVLDAHARSTIFAEAA